MQEIDSESFCCNFKPFGKGNGTETSPMDDALLAAELNELSFKERENVYEEIHGVARPHEETEQQITELLEDFQSELAKISRAKRKAYDRAVFLKPSLEQDTKFQLMFLRADRSDTMKAARRMTSYFEHKLELFGDAKLVKTITLDDLDDDDKHALGGILVLPNRDNSGRIVFLSDQRNFTYKTWKHQTRALWYEISSALEHEDVQINGVAIITYCVEMGNMPPHFADLVPRGANMVHNLPWRIVGYHFCYSDPILRPALRMVQLVMGKQSRLRFRSHYGSHLEVQYSLLTFGIQAPDALQDIHSPYWVKLVKTFIEERAKIEEIQKEKEAKTIPEGLCALYPNPNDVLLGRGRPFFSFPGNIKMTELLDEFRDEYMSSKVRLEKSMVAVNIIRKIESTGGRFLQRTSEGWIQVDEETAKDKVSQAMRMRAKSKSSNDGIKKEEEQCKPSREQTSPKVYHEAKRLRFSPQHGPEEADFDFNEKIFG